jgi:hypothetical protein
MRKRRSSNYLPILLTVTEETETKRVFELGFSERERDEEENRGHEGNRRSAYI